MACCPAPQIVVGGGGGPATVATTDTETVDLAGDGAAGTPLTASVRIAPAPNALTSTPDGLRVVPPTDTTVVAPVVGGAPAAVGTNRSVDIDVTESPADTWNVGARLTPPNGMVTLSNNVVNQPLAVLGSFVVPETGRYDIDAATQSQWDYWWIGQGGGPPLAIALALLVNLGIYVDGALNTQKEHRTNQEGPAGLSPWHDFQTWALSEGVTLTLNAGQTVDVRGLLSIGGSGLQSINGGSVQGGRLRWRKIAD